MHPILQDCHMSCENNIKFLWAQKNGPVFSSITMHFPANPKGFLNLVYLASGNQENWQDRYKKI